MTPICGAFSFSTVTTVTAFFLHEGVILGDVEIHGIAVEDVSIGADTSTSE